MLSLWLWQSLHSLVYPDGQADCLTKDDRGSSLPQVWQILTVIPVSSILGKPVFGVIADVADILSKIFGTFIVLE